MTDGKYSFQAINKDSYLIQRDRGICDNFLNFVDLTMTSSSASFNDVIKSLDANLNDPGGNSEYLMTFNGTGKPLKEFRHCLNIVCKIAISVM